MGTGTGLDLAAPADPIKRLSSWTEPNLHRLFFTLRLGPAAAGLLLSGGPGSCACSKAPIVKGTEIYSSFHRPSCSCFHQQVVGKLFRVESQRRRLRSAHPDPKGISSHLGLDFLKPATFPFSRKYTKKKKRQRVGQKVRFRTESVSGSAAEGRWRFKNSAPL